MRLSDAQIEEIKRSMMGLSGKAASETAALLAKQFGCDRGRIYHHSRDVRPKRASRSDKGKVSIPDEVLENMMSLTVKNDHAAPYLCRIVKANLGIDVPPSTYNRILRNRRMSRRENQLNLHPYRSWEAEYPNQLHQIDTTVAEQFYLDNSGAFQYDPLYYKNKREGKRPRLHIFSLVDDYSRVHFAMFMLGNNAGAWIDCIIEAWRKKDDLGWPFYGPPEIIYSDNDSVIKSNMFRAAMKSIGQGMGLKEGIQIKSHEVGNSQGKGKVENPFRVLAEFQKVTKIEKFKSVEEANHALWDFLYWKNSRRHTTTGEPPFQRWLRIDSNRVFRMPDKDILDRLKRKSTERLLSNRLTISIHGKEWQLPMTLPYTQLIGKKILIAYSDYQDDRIWILHDRTETEIVHKAPKVHPANEYRKIEDPPFVKEREALKAKDFPDWRFHGFNKDLDPKYYIPKEGQDLAVENIESPLATQGTVRSKVWFINRLVDEFLIESPPSAEETAFVSHVFGEKDDMLEKELEDLICRIRNGEITIHRDSAAGGVA